MYTSLPPSFLLPPPPHTHTHTKVADFDAVAGDDRKVGLVVYAFIAVKDDVDDFELGETLGRFKTVASALPSGPNCMGAQVKYLRDEKKFRFALLIPEDARELRPLTEIGQMGIPFKELVDTFEFTSECCASWNDLCGPDSEAKVAPMFFDCDLQFDLKLDKGAFAGVKNLVHTMRTAQGRPSTSMDHLVPVIFMRMLRMAKFEMHIASPMEAMDAVMDMVGKEQQRNDLVHALFDKGKQVTGGDLNRMLAAIPMMMNAAPLPPIAKELYDSAQTHLKGITEIGKRQR